MGFHQQEIETSIRTNLPVIFIVLNDNTVTPLKPDPFSSLNLQKEGTNKNNPKRNGNELTHPKTNEYILKL